MAKTSIVLILVVQVFLSETTQVREKTFYKNGKQIQKNFATATAATGYWWTSPPPYPTGTPWSIPYFLTTAGWWTNPTPTSNSQCQDRVSFCSQYVDYCHAPSYLP